MRRNATRRASAALMVMLLSFAAGAVPAAASALRTQQAPAGDSGCARQSDAVRIGVSPGATIGGLSPADLDRELTLARDAGAFAVRLDIDWSAIESTRGRFDWSRTDRVIDAVVAHGMCVHGIIAYTPRWARVAAAVNDSHSRPANPATFAAFAKTVVQRYQSRIEIWEVWNEPNIVTFFKPAPDVTAYSALIKATYTAIKQVQADSTVLAGGMAPAEDTNGNIAGTTFLSKMYAQGSNKYFDAFNVHPYTWPYLPNDPSTASWNTAMKMWSMRDTMITGGDSGKQIWITEFGAPTGTNPNSVSEQTQADSIGIVLDAVLGNDWLGPAYVYSLRDAGSDTADTEQNFGLVHRDWTPKIAYGRVDAYAAEHSGR
ncbi:cellulase family glycosylhydrolase [Rhodococcus sp. IEGM 1401]|uniref:endo-1,4-beta-xylanase n=1 Tax=unclassified Rhodococcus (in: high G+C Gram-positive bacteria) TaxID=192944 RepID=UPI0022B3D7EA|nr:MULTISPECIES: endo-1,4-beta-xylanase [unclassified Rhodococcus (in: high G+C Gram-positive bacteria)]MCZ4559705.1 cellulase family glycosylhydrolase [Rhodococcus sp. IEGM 1401]MDI9920251.1 cellulase family glycosylhydrolase [Rhodococcus sp. IEGM 1372]MDV8032285.1 cellulase family glycosylhydrolase [Rhodococcus sp. IEGM 1414]